MIQLPPNIKNDLSLISQVANQLRMKAYVVGGFPRDIISGKGVSEDTDLDITEENGNAFDLAFFVAARHNLPQPTVYESSGTAMVRMPSGRIVEFHNAYHNVPHIIDQLYKIKIEPTSLNKDVYSRDFTINTLLYDPDNNNILDITKMGVEDIRNKVLRTPLDPIKSLGIDPKRILRGVRFRIEMGLKPTPEYIEAEKYFIPTLANFMITHPNSQMLRDTVKKAFEANKEMAYNEFKKLGLTTYLPRVDEGMDDIARQQIFGDPNAINTSLAGKTKKAPKVESPVEEEYDPRQSLLDLEEEDNSGSEWSNPFSERKPSMYETQAYSISGPNVQLWVYNGSIDSRKMGNDGYFDATHSDFWEEPERFWRGRYDPDRNRVLIEPPANSSPVWSRKNNPSADLIKSIKSKFGKNVSITTANLKSWYRIAYSPENAYLRDYFRNGFDPYDYQYKIKDFIESNEEEDLYEYFENLDDYEVFDQWIAKASDDEKESFKEFISSSTSDDGYGPAYQTMSFEKHVPATWLVHFTNNPNSIAQGGFEFGHSEFEGLALTTHKTEKGRMREPGYNFAFELGSRDMKNALSGDGSKYGNGAVIFWGDGVKAYHSGDQEDQVVFWGEKVNRSMIFPIVMSKETGHWTALDNNDQVRKESEDFMEVADWVVRNYRLLQQVETKNTNRRRERSIREDKENSKKKLLIDSILANLDNMPEIKAEFEKHVADGYDDPEYILKYIIGLRKAEEAFNRMKSKTANKQSWYAIAKEKVPGGFSSGKPDSDFDQDQIKKGIEIELEHTNDREMAKEIAKDHLVEDPKYYDHLKEMEDKYVKKSSDKGWYRISDKFLRELDPYESQYSYTPRYEMNIQNDAFIHFTTKANAENILKDGVINPVNGTAYAVSAIYGDWVPTVQYSPQAMTSKKLKDDDMVAIYFLTSEKPTLLDWPNEGDEKPQVGNVEEVGWGRPIKLEAAEIISVEKAKGILSSTPEKLQHKEKKVPYGAGWKKPEDVDTNDLIDMGDEGIVEYASVITAKIKKLPNGKYRVVKRDGTGNLGTCDSLEEAKSRLKEVEYFKHKKAQKGPAPSALPLNPGEDAESKGMIQHLLESREKHRAYLRRRRMEKKKDTLNQKQVFDAIDDGNMSMLQRDPDKKQERIKNVFKNLGGAENGMV